MMRISLRTEMEGKGKQIGASSEVMVTEDGECPTIRFLGIGPLDDYWITVDDGVGMVRAIRGPAISDAGDSLRVDMSVMAVG